MTNRREFLVKFTMAAGAVSLLKPFNAFAAAGTHDTGVFAGDRLIILHTANLRGQWSALGNGGKLSGYGGLLNMRKKIEDIRREAVPVLLIDSGNMIDAQTYEDRLLFYKSMQAMRYDAVIPGETDLLHDPSCFTQMVNESGLQTIPPQQLQLSREAMFPYRMMKKGKQRVGIMHVPAFRKVSGYSQSAIAATMSRTARLLKEEKFCTLVVSLVQASRQNSLQLGMLSSHVDVIGSTAENTTIYNTEIIRNKMGNEVVLSFAGLKGTMMSRIDFAFNNKQEKISMGSKALFTSVKEQELTAILRRCNSSQV